MLVSLLWPPRGSRKQQETRHRSRLPRRFHQITERSASRHFTGGPRRRRGGGKEGLSVPMEPMEQSPEFRIGPLAGNRGVEAKTKAKFRKVRGQSRHPTIRQRYGHEGFLGVATPEQTADCAAVFGVCSLAKHNAGDVECTNVPDYSGRRGQDRISDRRRHIRITGRKENFTLIPSS
jgi:hypothetical protein